MRRIGLPLAAALLLLAAGGAWGQRLRPGPQVLTFHSEVDDTEQPYALYLPEPFDELKRYPLVITLHGAGSNHRLNLRRVFGRSNAEGETDLEASRYFPDWNDVPYIVAAPHARGTMGYQGVAEKDVWDVVADVKHRFAIDEDRIYLTGLSMGGGGALWIGLTRPDAWAAIAAVCPAPPPGTEEFAPNALHLPVRVMQGGADPVVAPAAVREWAERLRRLDVGVEYEEYEGVGHDSWVNAYADGRIFDWFGRFRRNPHPDRVRFSSDRYRYGEAYWVRLDSLTPGTVASIDVRFTDTNTLEAATSHLDGFTLRLAGHPRYRPGVQVRLRIDGHRLSLPAADSVSLQRDGQAWTAGKAAADPAAKGPGAEGPMSEAVAGRHVYVYGTGGAPSDDRLEARRAQARHAAEWSVDRGPFWGRVMVFPRAIADRDLRPSDLESSHLVLFGRRETNSLIARFAGRLPLELDPAADEHGLVYVYPAGGRYLLINSGLPWWEATSAPSVFAGSVPGLQLLGRGDYLLFRKGEVLAEGRFDRNWRLPEEAAARLRATGVVRIAQ